MSSPKELPYQKLQFYVTTSYPCGYIEKNRAQSLIASPYHLVNTDIYSELINQGFRRSGKFTYRPHCENCSACVPVRLVVDDFAPKRSQKRAYKKHQHLVAKVMQLGFHQAHFNLYQAYQIARHAEDVDISHEQDEEEQYRQFLCQSNVNSLMVEFKDTQDQVKIVSVIDQLQDGVSAVYTFYDTSEPSASYGTHAIMWLAEWTKQMRLPYLYLGYWINHSPKMAYKEKFKPLQKLINGEWQVAN